jgi:subtilisin family serine protease
MGTLAGGTQGHRIGVAPGAKWISCRNMDQGIGQPSTYMECFEFFLAPWSRNHRQPDPAKAPDVINNSWGCPKREEGCDVGLFQVAIESLRAAGIFVVAGAGNNGLGNDLKAHCATVKDPPAIYDAATTVGATTFFGSLLNTSSLGPVTSDGSDRRKPDLVAPGDLVWTSTTGGDYESFSGTSFAAPHVAGAVALLWEALPALRGDVDTTERALLESANPDVSVDSLVYPEQCGGTSPREVPNNYFGHGLLDVLAAYRKARVLLAEP